MLIFRFIGEILQQKNEKIGIHDGFVAISQQFKVNGIAVVIEGEPGRDSVRRDHPDDTNDITLMIGFGIVLGVFEDKEQRDGAREESGPASKRPCEIINLN